MRPNKINPGLGLVRIYFDSLVQDLNRPSKAFPGWSQLLLDIEEGAFIGG
jgi:hypothetical protein